MKEFQLKGLIAAAHTPFNPDRTLHATVVKKQAAHFAGSGIQTVFICGSTGECASLTVGERQTLAQHWLDVAPAHSLQIVVHVGTNSIDDAMVLAAQAENRGATAISAFSPSYFKPEDVGQLVACCARIAEAAPRTPFYYYDIPDMTGVSLSMVEFLRQAREAIPTLAGIKYTNDDMIEFQRCLHEFGEETDLLWGRDETLLAALALGVEGAVGSSYNFSAPIASRIMETFAEGNLDVARAEQQRLITLIQVLAKYGYLAAAKNVMSLAGIEVGPPRLPLKALSPEQIEALHVDLQETGFLA